MKQTKIKLFILLLGLIIPAAWCGTNDTKVFDGESHIEIKKSSVQGTPRDSSIIASINGHYLTVVFTENIGQITVEVSRVNGGETQVESSPTPNGVNFYIYETGSYIVTFTLSNGDVYYGEFEVLD